jgi:hypothetical protein
MKKRLVFLTILAVAVMFLVTTKNVNSQKDETVIETLKSNEPLKIISFDVQGKKILSGEKFPDSDTWTKTLSINVQNSSGKKVSHIGIGIFFVRPKDQENVPIFHYSLIRGNKKSALKLLASGFEFASSESADKSTKMVLSDKEYREVRESLDQLGYPVKIEKIQVQIEEIVFEDGKLWSLGSWYKMDPDDPDKLIRLKDEDKGSENKTATFSSENANERCYSPYYGDRVCTEEGGRRCIARNVSLPSEEPPTHRLVHGYERCYVELPNGERGESCGSNTEVTLATPCPTPTPAPTPHPGSCNAPPNYGQYSSGCAPGLVATGGVCTNSPTFINHCNLFGGYDDSSCGCFGFCDPSNGAGCSPVVVDVLGNGFAMTSAENGVMFDLQGNGTPQQFSWIAAGSDDLV